MLESGNWITPYYNYEIRTAKPAFLYWLQAASFRRFGVNECAARLPAVLCGLGSVWVTYELGRRMFCPVHGPARRAGAGQLHRVLPDLARGHARPAARPVPHLGVLLYWVGLARATAAGGSSRSGACRRAGHADQGADRRRHARAGDPAAPGSGRGSSASLWDRRLFVGADGLYRWSPPRGTCWSRSTPRASGSKRSS